MTRIRESIAAVLAAGALLALIALVAAPSALAADHGVDIAGFAFSPGTITVAVGDTVTWSNADAQGHTATADDGSFDTGTIATSSPKSVTFSTAGTFGYHCKIHPSMTATVVVAAAATAPPTDTALDPARPAETPWAVLVLAALAGGALGLRIRAGATRTPSARR